jgi:hypothetical protein
VDLHILEDVPTLLDPLEQARVLGGSPSSDWMMRLRDGRTPQATDFFRTYYLPAIDELLDMRGEGEAPARQLLGRVLRALEVRDFQSLSRTLDWCLKYDIFELHNSEYFQTSAEGLSVNDRQTLDYQFRAITDPFFEEIEDELGIYQVIAGPDLADAVMNAPPGSRARQRTDMARALSDQISSMDWDGITLESGRSIALKELSEDVTSSADVFEEHA